MTIRHVIWDFNGTLLDDVDCCVGTLNTLLRERNLSPISRADYLARFGFPVRNFYLALGFDFDREQFEHVSASYMARYAARLDAAAPHSGVHAVLDGIRRRGLPQSVVSAMERALLVELLARFGLSAHMAHIRGLEHQNATSKIEIGRALRDELGLAAHELLLVGDTLHDHELAQALGCPCLLYARGHQARERLAASGAPVIEALHEVEAFLDRDGGRR